MTTNFRDLGDALMVTTSRCRSMCQLRRMSGISGGRGPVMPNVTLRKTLRMLAQVFESTKRASQETMTASMWHTLVQVDQL